MFLEWGEFELDGEWYSRCIGSSFGGSGDG